MRKLSVMTMNSMMCLLAVFSILACQSAYYKTMEEFGYHKREILVDRVRDARNQQQEAKEQFRSALDQFSEVVNFKGGELEKKYEKLSAEFKRCETRAEDVRGRITSVESVGEALFEEWETELSQYSNPALRRESERKLVTTRKQYDRMLDAMKRAESKIEPVLSAFRDQVLFLKHNLNARAVASLRIELSVVENEVADLIREMEVSIKESDEFIKNLGSSEK